MARSLFRDAALSAPENCGPVARARAHSRAKLVGSDFHYAVLIAPSRQRLPLAALYALWREIDEIAEECRDPMVAAHKLAWWHEEVDALLDGRPRHPASIAVQTFARDGLMRDPLHGQLEAMARSFVWPGFDNLQALVDHARRTDGALVALVARLLGAGDVDLADLGAGLRIARLIARLGADVRRGRLELPREELARRGLAETEVLLLRENEALRDVLAALHEHSVRLLALPAILPPSTRAGLVPLFALAAIARTTLEEVARDGYRVLDRGVALTPVRKLWLAWTARRAAARE